MKVMLTIMKRNHYIYILSILLFVSCATKQNSTIIHYNYDMKQDLTNYMVFPYGSIVIPDKWDKTDYNSVSRQQFFKNQEEIIIAIAFNPCNKYEFSTDNATKGFDFVVAFYTWESAYFVNSYNLQQNIIEKNEKNHSIIWRVYGDYNNSFLDTYFLFGEKDGVAHNYSILHTDKWTAEQKIEFLKSIYEQKIK